MSFATPRRSPARALEVAREICALPREPMLRTRALARRDLIDLFGNPGHALIHEREFGAMGVGACGSCPRRRNA